MASKVKTPVASAAKTNGSLPKGWRMVRFGDVVRDVNEAERNPLDAGLERFVGLEHIEPENLHLKQWGNLADGDVSFTKRFRKGQVLFGKRRAYQRKVAVAEFDGICSSDILTFEPKDDSLIPELLPFIVQSDGFFQHALGTSSGSLSPRTRWSQLQDFEFPLPPNDKQRQIADILWGADEAIECSRLAHDGMETLISALSDSLFRGETQHVKRWEIVPVADVCDRVTVGIVVEPSKYYCKSGVKCFRSANVRRGQVQDSDWVYISAEAHQMHAKSILKAGDVMVVRSGANAGMCSVVPEQYAGANCIDIVFATPNHNALESGWLELFINSSAGRIEIMRGERGLAQRHFGVSAMKEMRIPLPPLETQKRYVAIVRGLREGVLETGANIASLKALQNAVATRMMHSNMNGPEEST